MRFSNQRLLSDTSYFACQIEDTYKTSFQFCLSFTSGFVQSFDQSVAVMVSSTTLEIFQQNAVHFELESEMLPHSLKSSWCSTNITANILTGKKSSQMAEEGMNIPLSPLAVALLFSHHSQFMYHIFYFLEHARPCSGLLAKMVECHNYQL